MGKLRSAIGALALVTDDTAVLLERLDQFARRIEEAELATVICVLIDPAAGTVTYSSAGHLPALLVDDRGEASFLDGGRGFPLGVDPAAARAQGRATIGPGATLVLFTDGLIESPSRPIAQGLEALREAVRSRAAQEPERLCDELLDELGDGPSDDVAVVCLRFGRSPVESQVWRFPALPSQIGVARHALGEWLAERGVPRTTCDDLVLALVEACSNAVRHAYRGGEGTVTVQVRREEESLTIRVRDTGRWTVPLPSAEGGWGLEIIRALADDIHIHGTPYGTTVIMSKRLPAPDAPRRRSRRAVPARP
jgi:anti-sigma regulatory factor (Ser/Thr protein kinase)